MLGQFALDADYLAQILPQEQWQHAIGFSFSGTTQPPRAGDAYRAFKRQSPNTEPALLLLPYLYSELRLLATGIQLAGPNLTPQTFSDGLRAYQSTLGPEGTIAYPAGDFSGPQDFRIIRYDSTATSPSNDRPGTYRDNGQRYLLGTLPEGDIPVPADR